MLTKATRQVVRFDAAEALPSRLEVLEAQGLPEEGRLTARLHALLDGAMTAFSELAESRALAEEVGPERFAAVLGPLGVPGQELAVGQVYPRAAALALFVATLGEPVGAKIARLFAENALAEAWMLDAVASAAADRLADRLAERFRETLAGRSLADVRVLPYSPGYCGWPTRGQRPLFDALRPEEIGVTLNDSCLMSPLKSVSGVLVAGTAESHRFPTDLPCCAACSTRECDRRMASTLDAS